MDGRGARFVLLDALEVSPAWEDERARHGLLFGFKAAPNGVTARMHEVVAGEVLHPCPGVFADRIHGICGSNVKGKGVRRMQPGEGCWSGCRMRFRGEGESWDSAC
jgi:hypothetical protein